MSDMNSVIFKAAALRPVIQEAIQNQCPLLLVKDSGLYFMAEKGELNPDTGRRLVAYADGFDPDKTDFDHWYPSLRAICGGDDFAETIESDTSLMQLVLNMHVNIRVAFTAHSLTIVPVIPDLPV